MSETSTTKITYTISNFKETKQKVLNWAQRFNTFCFLDNHQYQLLPHSQECLLGAGVKRQLKVNAGNALEQLQKWINTNSSSDRDSLPRQFVGQTPGWLFGHLGYDLKNEIEKVHSSHVDVIEFSDLYFFEPEILVRLTEQEIIIEGANPAIVFEEINNAVKRDIPKTTPPAISSSLSREEYITVVKKLKEHILRGDCYEINFCQDFFAEDCIIDPLNIYERLSIVSPNPFSALYRTNDQWLICASPERFLKKQGNSILSQPIKGTSKRELLNTELDELNKLDLFHSAKDRSENVMVVDLVRNDLAKICKEGTVKVDELYGIYSFPQVHQMISTISGELNDGISFSEIIQATFPMGSMTGAPKKRVMELIEQYEITKRGIFSGAVGYISPEGGFDFNVVIRSIMYNAATSYLSFKAGSGITFYSDPEMEWEECLLKAAAIKKVLEINY